MKISYLAIVHGGFYINQHGPTMACLTHVCIDWSTIDLSKRPLAYRVISRLGALGSMTRNLIGRPNVEGSTLRSSQCPSTLTEAYAYLTTPNFCLFCGHGGMRSTHAGTAECPRNCFRRPMHVPEIM